MSRRSGESCRGSTLSCHCSASRRWRRSCDTLNQPRFQATLLGGFAVIALLLAAIGIYGVLSHAVSQRTQEVGIRMAMGARHSDVRSLILRQHVSPAIVGITIGIVGAVALSRFLSSLLYGVRAVDP